jgi:hypothetical protein
LKRKTLRRFVAKSIAESISAFSAIIKGVPRVFTAIVHFKLPSPVSRQKAKELFTGTAPRYRDMAGLIRKYYLLSEDGSPKKSPRNFSLSNGAGSSRIDTARSPLLVTTKVR